MWENVLKSVYNFKVSQERKLDFNSGRFWLRDGQRVLGRFPLILAVHTLRSRKVMSENSGLKGQYHAIFSNTLKIEIRLLAAKL